MSRPRQYIKQVFFLNIDRKLYWSSNIQWKIFNVLYDIYKKLSHV